MLYRLILIQLWIIALWVAITRLWKDPPDANAETAPHPPRRELSDQAMRLSCANVEAELRAKLNWPE